MKIRTLLTLLFAFALSLTIQAQPSERPQNRLQRSMPPRKNMEKEMSIQLYSLRDLIGDADKYAANHKEVFAKLKEFGYTSVEAANYADGKFYGVSPAQFKADVEEAGLVALSSHTTRTLTDQELATGNFSESIAWWQQAIADHKAAGMKYIVTPWTSTPKTIAEANIICAYNNKIGQMCKDSGIEYGYHSHSHEYQKVGNEVWYDYFISHTNPDLVFFQMDVYWAVMAQQSPVAYFKKYPGRFKMLHIKDKYELGESGMVGFDAIFRHAREAGLQDFVVEIEETDGTIDILEAAKRSANYLCRLRYVRPSYSETEE